MELKLDKTKEYALALEGGGAKGAYQIGVWQALREAGIKIKAVAGTSVGALNGAMICMDNFELAMDIWRNMRLSRVVAVDEANEEELRKLVAGEAEFSDVHELLSQAKDILKKRGLDIAPLRQLVYELADEEKMRNSPVEFFITTVNLSDMKTMDVKLNGLGKEEIANMLIASAYHPTFRQEKLGGKHYADGGLVDNLPIYPLVQAGYKDIIAVRIPGFGMERRFKLPKDVQLHYVDTVHDLGAILNFDSRQSKRNLLIGRLDGMKLLYGLEGREYYIERTLSEGEALEKLVEWYGKDCSLRQLFEKELPKIARKLDAGREDYYQLFIAALEEKAEAWGIEKLEVYKDTELIEKTEA